MVFKVFVLLALLVAGGCGASPGERTIALVEGDRIVEQDLVVFLLLQGMEGVEGIDGDMKREILSQLIEEVLIAKEAERYGVKVEDREVEAFLGEVPERLRMGMDPVRLEGWIRRRLLAERMIGEVVKDVVVEEEDLRSYYRARKEKFKRRGRMRASHIVVATEDEAREVLRRLEKGEDFGRVAREVSISPDRERGGDLGYFHMGEMPEEFEKALAEMEVGELSPIVRTPYGYHILKLTSREGPAVPSFEEVKSWIARRIRAERVEAIFRNWLDRLKERSVIRIDEKALQEALK